jgi:ABC-type uncharacterized transport system ATPase subunit
MAGQAALTADRLTKRFGDRVAFQDVFFQVGYCELLGFLGGRRGQAGNGIVTFIAAGAWSLDRHEIGLGQHCWFLGVDIRL